jgi:hypothetical protein
MPCGNECGRDGLADGGNLDVRHGG